MKIYPRVELSELQRQKIRNDIWFLYGNRGTKHTNSGHKFIQCLLDGHDLRSFYKPSKEVMKAVDDILKSTYEKEAL